MPPWMPGHDSPVYLGQSRRILTPAEKRLIARWVQGGARIGAGRPVKPVGSSSSAPGTTMTLAPARSYLPKAAVGGLDDYHCFLLEPHLTQDAYVTSAVIKPQQPAIVMQVHYNLIHKAKRDRSSALLRFAPAATTKLTPLNTILIPAPVELPCPRGVRSRLCSRDVAVQEEIKKYGYDAALIPSGLLYICGKSLSDYPSSPASVKSLTTSCDRHVNRPLRIYGVAGHMHIRGYDIRIELNGKTLLHIPRWNFHWQDAYYLEHPVDANVGDTIRVSCKFDNSAIKQPLVNGKLLKPRYVLWGEGTTDEMCLGLLQAADR